MTDNRKWLITLREVREAFMKVRKEREAADERAAIAQAFNDRYTFRHHWREEQERLPGTAMYGLLPRGGYAWMCPECNQVHKATSCSVFSGLQYPACCGTGEGHRISHGIRTS